MPSFSDERLKGSRGYSILLFPVGARLSPLSLPRDRDTSQTEEKKGRRWFGSFFFAFVLCYTSFLPPLPEGDPYVCKETLDQIELFNESVQSSFYLLSFLRDCFYEATFGEFRVENLSSNSCCWSFNQVSIYLRILSISENNNLTN